ncbi:MAG: Pyruvate formate-lyase 1-activating enzyme [candidate division WS2 bacterium]|uniref:Pyruvate formate-lyase 1-activating enzyme n=1 Tax=Psychracetigena formicireducens TaxID=2986056 RepID=A0A9E2F4H1_PSYF1|nr:Pyruvate formate-lyase 1-activating enzyme [Candidatus Psychracetigena formicireducens]
MKIKFVQPTTLVDFPGKLACTIFLFGCNFKCGFCYNPELVLKEATKDLKEEDVLKFLEKRKGELEGVCFTGGEPLMTIEEDFLRKVKEKGYLIKVDTNGSFPERLKEFIEKGLIDFVAMDVKGRKEDYEKISCSKVDLEKIEGSMRIASSLESYEFRTTFVPRFHDVDKIIKEVDWIHSIIGKKIKKFCLQGFKNSGKFVDKSFSEEKNVFEEELREVKEKILEENLVEDIVLRL